MGQDNGEGVGCNRRAAGITKTQLQPETEQKDSDETGQIVPDESDSDEDNIPFSEIQAMKAKKKTEIPQLKTGEACVGNLILKKFETGVFKGTVIDHYSWGPLMERQTQSPKTKLTLVVSVLVKHL